MNKALKVWNPVGFQKKGEGLLPADRSDRSPFTDNKIYYIKIDIKIETGYQNKRDFLWIAQKSQDKEIAKGFVNELRVECRKLESFPNRGSLPKDRILKSLGYRFLAYRDYLIFFLADEEKRVVAIYQVTVDNL